MDSGKMAFALAVCMRYCDTVQSSITVYLVANLCSKMANNQSLQQSDIDTILLDPKGVAIIAAHCNSNLRDAAAGEFLREGGRPLMWLHPPIHKHRVNGHALRMWRVSRLSFLRLLPRACWGIFGDVVVDLRNRSHGVLRHSVGGEQWGNMTPENHVVSSVPTTSFTTKSVKFGVPTPRAPRDAHHLPLGYSHVFCVVCCACFCFIWLWLLLS